MKNINIEYFLSTTLTYWNDISKEEQQEIINNATYVTYKAGESVYNAIDDCVGMFIVISGELRTYILSDSGKEFTLFRLNSGNVCVLSVSCLLKDITFDAFVDAETDCELLLINAITLSKLHAQNPLIENFALKIAADKFSAVIKAMEQMLFTSLESRLANFLINEYKQQNSSKILLTHEQIAKYIGSAREVVSRTLKQFEKENIVNLFRGGVEILDIEKLAAMAAI